MSRCKCNMSLENKSCDRQDPDANGNECIAAQLLGTKERGLSFEGR